MTDHELDLQRHLDEELNRLQPRPLPAEAVYERARAIRHTRRVRGAAGALVTAAVLGMSLPVLGSMKPWQSAAGGGNAVTVNAPHTDKKGRYVFSGSEEGKHWSVTVAPGDCLSRTDFVIACGSGAIDDPAAFTDAATTTPGSPTKYAVYFRSDIARIDVGLSDGEQVVLSPGTVHSNKVALLVVPSKIGISRIDAYANDGSLVAYSIPFQADGMAHIAMWYSPGETPTQSEASGTITGRTPQGKPASVDVRIGPFGICYTVAQRPEPRAISATNCRPLTALGSDDVPPRSLDWLALGGRVDGLVDHVDYELTTGTIRAQVVHIDRYSFAVCFADFGFQELGKTAFDASGNVLAYSLPPTKP